MIDEAFKIREATKGAFFSDEVAGVALHILQNHLTFSEDEMRSMLEVMAQNAVALSSMFTVEAVLGDEKLEELASTMSMLTEMENLSDGFFENGDC